MIEISRGPWFGGDEVEKQLGKREAFRTRFSAKVERHKRRNSQLSHAYAGDPEEGRRLDHEVSKASFCEHLQEAGGRLQETFPVLDNGHLDTSSWNAGGYTSLLELAAQGELYVLGNIPDELQRAAAELMHDYPEIMFYYNINTTDHTFSYTAILQEPKG